MPSTVFCNAGVVGGTNAMAQCIQILDTLASSLQTLPDMPSDRLPDIKAHIAIVRSTADAWPRQHRQDVVALLGHIRDFGIAFINVDALALRPLLAALSKPGAAAHPTSLDAATKAIADIDARLAACEASSHSQALATEAFMSDVAARLSTLNGDMATVSQRLQADQNSAATLRAQREDLQHKIAECNNRRKYYWLMGPLGGLIAGEIDKAASGISSIEGRLREIDADLHGVGEDVGYLTALSPALGAFIQALSRMVIGANGLTAGVQGLKSQLSDLNHALEQIPGSGAFAAAQLEAGVADWSDIAGSLGHLK